MQAYFHPALLLLIRLTWRGGFRQFRQSLKTFRGLFQVGFMLALILYFIGSMIFVGVLASQTNQVSATLDKMQSDFLTIGLFGVTCYVVLFSTGDATVYFTASEVAFLFPAPLTRKQLLTYQLLKGVTGILAISVFFSFFAIAQISLMIPRLIGTMLTVGFLQLITMNVAFARQVLQHKVQQRIRQVVGCIVGVLVLLAIEQMRASMPEGDLSAYLKAFQNSTAGSWALAPFQVFIRMLRAPNLAAFVPPASIVLAVDTALLVTAYRLDALSLEAALGISEKLSARIKQIQSKGVWSAFNNPTSAVTRRRLPTLPFWFGIGPVVCQRMTTTIRASNSFFVALGSALSVASVIVYMIARSKSGPHLAPIASVATMSYMSLLICLTLQNDIERVGFLKSLPLRSVAIVLGELLGFVVFLSAVQSLFMLAVAGFFPDSLFWLMCGACVTLPLNFLLFSVDKLVFYVYPTRLVKGPPGDFQNSGKQMIFMTLKMLMMAAAFLFVGLAALPGAILFQSPILAIVGSVIMLLLECIAIVPLLTLVFDRFDPSVTLVT